MHNFSALLSINCYLKMNEGFSLTVRFLSIFSLQTHPVNIGPEFEFVVALKAFTSHWSLSP